MLRASIESCNSSSKTVKAEVQKAKAKYSELESNTIVISSDVEENYSSDDIEELANHGPLRDAVNESVGKHKRQSAGIRLKTKKTTVTELGHSSCMKGQTKEYLDKKKKLFATAADPKKNTPITVRCELFLQSKTGRKTGPQVPLQIRSFQQSEVCLNHLLYCVYLMRHFVAFQLYFT